MSQLGSLTPLGPGIEAAQAAMVAFGLSNLDRAVIDVSTDGFGNQGTDPGTAADNAILAGIDQVNCIGIKNFGSADPDCSFIAGVGAFSINAGNFTEFQVKLEEKLRRELGVPEPATLLILGMGLLGFGWMKRRG